MRGRRKQSPPPPQSPPFQKGITAWLAAKTQMDTDGLTVNLFRQVAKCMYAELAEEVSPTLGGRQRWRHHPTLRTAALRARRNASQLSPTTLPTTTRPAATFAPVDDVGGAAGFTSAS